MEQKINVYSNLFLGYNRMSYLRSATYFVLISILLLLATMQNATAQNPKIPFTFTVAQTGKTSAGIYKRSNNVLIKTLWNNVPYTAGTHTAYWDRTNDDGYLLTDTGYYVKVISSNVSYTWEGAVGNNSDSISGSSKIRAFQRFYTLAFSGNYGYYGVGYTEGVPSCYKFDINKPKNKINILFSPYSDIDAQVDYVSTDGNIVYWAGYDPYNPDVSLVFATNNSNDKETIFSNGTSQSMLYGRTYASALDVYSDPKARPSGLAVQKNGSFLFVAHKDLNVINVIDKSSGALINAISMTKPREICVDDSGCLWVLSNVNTIEKYYVNSNGTLSSAILSINGLAEPLAMAVTPNGTKIYIIDGAASQQVKIFDNSTGAVISTFGSAGGYINNASVNDYKFYFSDSVTMLSKPFIAFQEDSSFWLGDVGNERVQHYSPNGTFINRIMCLPHSYSTVVDRNNPTRVFNEYLEFSIDYSKPMGSDNGSWTLVNNWRRGIKSNYYQDDKLRIFIQLITLSNNKTYAILDEYATGGIRKPEIVELVPNAKIRYTGIKLQDFAQDIIEPNGTLRRIVSGRNVGDSGYWEIQPLTGFNGQNNPIWGAKQKLAWIPKITNTDPAFSNIMSPAVTSGGYNVIFNSEKDNKGYHLGAIKNGTNQWAWRTSKATQRNYLGPMPSDGAFDCGNYVEYPGGDVYALEKNIFWNYHGEFWKNSQTNIWNHYHESGLMVSQFGVVAPDAKAKEDEAYKMGAGNVLSSTFVKVGADYYLYHNDESVHGGVHRWKISNLNSIVEQNFSINIQPLLGTGLIGTFYDGVELNNMKMKVSALHSTVNLSSAPAEISNSNSFSGKWTGFIKINNTQAHTFYTNTSAGVRLWVNNVLVIDKWNNSSQTEFSSAAINLVAGTIYPIRMEIAGGNATLSWSSASQSKQIIPSSVLFPGDVADYSKGYDLLEGLENSPAVENGKYGWTRNGVLNKYNNGQDYFVLSVGNRSHLPQQPDLSIKYRDFNNNSTVSRDLSIPNSCISAWKVNGEINLEYNYPNIDNGEYSYFDILDNNGKIISRVTHEMQYISSNSKVHQIKMNGKAIFNRNEKVLYDDLNTFKQFEISLSNGSIVFSFGNYQSITSNLYDNTANWRNPQTIRFSYKGGSYDRAIDLRNLKFVPTVTEKPVITPSGNIKFCQGDSVVLNSSPANSYLWNTGATTQSIKVKSSGVYFVNSVDQYGCKTPSNSANINVFAVTKPIINEGKTIAICTGDSINLTTGPAQSYTWNTGGNTNSIKVKQAGNYSAQVIDNNGCKATSDLTQISLNALPNASITADGSTTFCQGKFVTLSSNSASAYNWSSGQNTQNIQVFTSGSYSVQITDNNGCKNRSNTIDVTVAPYPKPIITAGSATVFCEGDSVRLTSSEASVYLWSTGENTQSIMVKKGGSYNVAAGDGQGCAAISDPSSVTVNNRPTPTISANGNILSSNYNTGNQWYLEGKIIPGAVNPTFEATTSGSYTLGVKDNNTCEGQSDVYVHTVAKVGVSSISELGGIVIAPNPNKGNFKIIHSLSGINVEIFNLLGEKIYSNVQSNGDIDISLEAKGMYIVRISSGDKVHIEKIIVE